MQAKRILKDLKYFTEDVVYFPKREIVTYDVYAESKDNLHHRIEALNKLHNNKARVVVTTIESLMQKTVGKEVLYKNTINLKVGDTFKLDDIKEKLVNLGYERCEQVEGRGQFSIRGGIVDISETSDKLGIRIEFWGDTVDSIRNFDIVSQRTIDMIDNAVIYPSNEFVLEKDLEQICNNILKNEYTEKQLEIVNEDVELIRSGDYINKIDKYFNNFYSEPKTLLDYLNSEFIIFLDEITKIKTRSQNIINDNKSVIKSLVEKNKIIVQSLENQVDYIDFIKELENTQIVYLEKQDLGFVDKQNMYAKKNEYSFSCREVNFFRSGMDLLFQEVQQAKEKNKTVIILRRKL